MFCLGPTMNAFAVAAVIVTPLELTLIDDAVANDDNDDGDSAGAEHRGIFPRPVQPQSTAQLPGWQVPD